MRLTLLLAVSLFAADFAQAAQDHSPPGPETLHQRLRASDASMREGITITAKLRTPTSPFPTFDTERLVVEATFTMKGDTWALRLDTDKGLPLPRYPTMPDAALRGRIDRKGDVDVIRPVRQSALREKDFLGTHLTQRLFRLDTAGNVHEQELGSLVELLRPTDTLFSFSPIEAYVLVFSSGRGFSGMIDKVTEVAQLPDGQLLCRAIGKYPRGKPWTWELTVVPGDQYRVTHAKRLDGTELDAEMRNEGTQEFAGGLIPVRGTFSLAPATLGDCTELCYEITFLAMSDTEDQELISYNRTLLRNLEKGQSVIDFRSGVAEPHTVGEETRVRKAHSHVAAVPAPTPHSRAHLWYLIMAANAFVALLWAVWRYRRSMNAESTP